MQFNKIIILTNKGMLSKTSFLKLNHSSVNKYVSLLLFSGWKSYLMNSMIPLQVLFFHLAQDTCHGSSWLQLPKQVLASGTKDTMEHRN